MTTIEIMGFRRPGSEWNGKGALARFARLLLNLTKQPGQGIDPYAAERARLELELRELTHLRNPQA